jgi:hypothetical protein
MRCVCNIQLNRRRRLGALLRWVCLLATTMQRSIRRTTHDVQHATQPTTDHRMQRSAAAGRTGVGTMHETRSSHQLGDKAAQPARASAGVGAGAGAPQPRRRRRAAHERIAPPLGRRKNPPFARSGSARAPDTTQRTARPCAVGRLSVCNMQRATRAAATCNTQRCNTPTRADATRADATRIDAT